MKNIFRLIMVLSMFITGVAFLPVVGLPAQGFHWERYASAYQPASLEIDHSSGRPGSFFALRAEEFAPESTVNILVNGHLLGVGQTDDDGEFRFTIATAGADPGQYQVQVTGSHTAFAQFVLSPDAPLWPRDRNDPVYVVPPGTALIRIMLPAMFK